MLVRPLTRETNTRMGAPPQRPIVAGPQVRGPRPLMADFPIRVPGLYVHWLPFDILQFGCCTKHLIKDVGILKL